MAETQVEDPIALFLEWFEQAKQGNNPDPTACAVATTDAENCPSVRMVLLKDADERGFVFYTNTESRKAEELAANPCAALLFHWRDPHRQVRVKGPAELVSDDEADAYFATRHRSSQIGAWASAQSQPMKDKYELERKVVEFTARFALGAIPRPPYWSGYRVAPVGIEFWEERRFRLHKRLAFVRDGSTWQKQRLYP